MKLKKLLKNLPIAAVRGSSEVEITGLCAHSKFAAPGALFLSKKGKEPSSGRYIAEAVSAGAAAVVTDLFDPFLRQVTQVIHHDPAALEPELARRYYGGPSEELLLVGITGTSGKTTTSYLVRALLEAMLGPTGLLGTVEWIVGKSLLPSLYTTPDLFTTSRLLREMVQQEALAAVMEVSSHALKQGRVIDLDFDVAIFTNLTRDHLDYHGNFEEYAAAKALLFEQLGRVARSRKSVPRWAILNADSSWSGRMVRSCCAPWLTYGLGEEAQVRGVNLVTTMEGTLFDLLHEGRTYRFSTPLIGKFNVYNMLAAIAFGLSQGWELERMAAILAQVPPVPGRLEKVVNSLGISLYVDYSHKGDALENVLKALRSISPNRMIVVFGCGGGRDTTKRPEMGRIAEELSDLVVVTNDNPRNEEPLEIVRQILAGMKSPEKAVVHLDRAQAIRFAIQSARERDVVLIAGKGNESYQIVGQRFLPFDDRIVARTICSELATATI